MHFLMMAIGVVILVYGIVSSFDLGINMLFMGMGMLILALGLVLRKRTYSYSERT